MIRFLGFKPLLLAALVAGPAFLAQAHEPRGIGEEGVAALKAGKTKQAIRDLTLAIQRKEADGYDIYARGVAHARRSDWRAAADDFAASLQRDPDSPMTRLALVAAHLIMGEKSIDAGLGAQPENQSGSRDTALTQAENAGANVDETKISSSLVACQESFRSVIRTLQVAAPQLEGLLRSDQELQRRIKSCEPTEETMDFLHGMDFVGSQLGWVTGWHGRILHTNDGGGTWKNQRSGTKTPLIAVDFLDARIGYALGLDGTVIQTTDGGIHWKPRSKIGSALLDEFSTLTCRDAKTCWASGRTGGAIFITNDGGATWTEQRTPSLAPVGCIQFIDNFRGWAATAAGEILGSEDGGRSWKILLSRPGRALWSLHFLDSSNGWATGEAGTILRTKDGGHTWEDQTENLPAGRLSRSELRFHVVRFADPNHGWVAGLLGVIAHTDDGGDTWKIQALLGNNNSTFYAMRVLSSSVILASGNAGIILATIDGGQVWFPTHGSVLDRLKAIARFLEERKIAPHAL